MYEPNVLVISHNVFSSRNNMGKTLASLFHGWDPSKVAQLYFHNEVPELPICCRYFRFTDLDALQSIVQRHGRGRIWNGPAPPAERCDGTSLAGRLYRFGHGVRIPAVGLLRDAAWLASGWRTRRLCGWIETIQPEVIFYAAGDSLFSYRIAHWLSGRYRIPIVTVCYDDYYTEWPHRSPLGRMQHRLLLRWAHRVADEALCLLTASPAMAEQYSRMFPVQCWELYTPAKLHPVPPEHRHGVAYFGNLNLGRWRQLVSIGRALQSLQLPGIPRVLDVYSLEQDPHILKHMCRENGICFHGSISDAAVTKKSAESLLVIHTESFARREARRVRFSISTKIASYLACGACILAYGPPDVASIRYLQEHDAAFIVPAKEDLSAGLYAALTQEERRRTVQCHARQLAMQNHDPWQCRQMLRAVLSEAAVCHTERRSRK